MEGRDFGSPPIGEGQPADSAGTSEKLKLAVRRARVDDAERTKVVAELRGAEIARLEMLRDEILPVAAEIPADVDLFDIGLVATERPRLFIDMIGFVEMGHDRRTYRFIQDTRHGRVVIAESERIEPIVDAVGDYIARRLIEREKALAADGTLERAARAYAVAQETIAARREPQANVPKPAKKAGPIGRLFASFVEVSGSVLLCGLLALGAFTAWKYAAAFWFARHGWR
ncbi:MAG: hypothetical protein WBZ39_02025 [Methylovirgula sp.]